MFKFEYMDGWIHSNVLNSMNRQTENISSYTTHQLNQHSDSITGFERLPPPSRETSFADHKCMHVYVSTILSSLSSKIPSPPQLSQVFKFGLVKGVLLCSDMAFEAGMKPLFQQHMGAMPAIL